MADLDVPWNDQDSSARTIVVDYLSIAVLFPSVHGWQYQHPYRIIGRRGERRRGYVPGAIRARPHRPWRDVVQAVGATEPVAQIAVETRPCMTREQSATPGAQGRRPVRSLTCSKTC